MRQEDIDGRLQNLEVSVQSVTLRLAAIEARLSMEAKPAPAAEAVQEVRDLGIQFGPPPVIDNRTTFQRLNEAVQTNVPRSIPSMSPDPTASVQEAFRPSKIDDVLASQADDMEYKFGINGLLRGGVVVIVFAILFLVAMMVGRGYVTPQIQFAGELLLCASFIGVGLWKRNEREDFGQLMVGLGSFGLYASFAGAHVYKHLFEGETLVALFSLLSLVNLGYSGWRSSKSFLIIGLLGGLAAAMMPMQKERVLLDFALHFMILVPCAAIIVRNKWNGMAALMWVISTAALIPATTSDFLQAYRVGAVYLNCAIALYACGKVFKPSEFDKHAAIQPIMLVLTGLYAIAVDTGHKGSLHALALTGIGLAVGYLMAEDTKAKYATWLGALIVFAIITPLGFTQQVATFYYGVEALVLVILALQFRLVALWTVGFATFMFSMVAYLYFPDKQTFILARLSPVQENLLLAMSALTVVLNIRYALSKQNNKDFGDAALFFGSSLLVAFFTRSMNVFLGNGNTALGTVDISTLGLAMASLMTAAFAVHMKRMGMFAVGCLLAVLAGAMAMLREPDASPQWMSPVMLLMVAGSVYLGARFYEREGDKSMAEVAVVIEGIAHAMFTLRAAQLAGAHHLLGLSTQTVVFFGIALFSLVWTAIAMKTRRRAHLVLGWVAFISAGLSGMAFMGQSGPVWLSPLMLFAPILSLSVLYFITPRGEVEEGVVSGVLVVVWWTLMTLFLKQELMREWIGLKEVAAYTVSWVVVAVTLIVVGFKFERRHLRYGSLAIFGLTVCKVFLIDLSELDAFIRVLMLMLTGLGMVGGGYWYILWRRGAVKQ